MENLLEIDPGMIQDIATKCVLGYTTNGTDLSDSIAEHAKELHLNPEQIKRVLEATNTIAYLRLLKDSKERTFEFPVATYAQVLGKITLPSTPATAAASPVSADPVTGSVELDKQASFAGEDNDFVSVEEKRTMLVKVAQRLFDEIQHLEVESCILAEGLVKAAAELKADELGYEKLVTVAGEDNFETLNALCGFTKSAEEKSFIFNSAQLTKAEKVAGLYKEACEFNAGLKEKKAQLASILEKQAFFGSLGRMFGSALAAPVRAGLGVAKSVGTGAARGIETASNNIGSKLGVTKLNPSVANRKVLGMKPATWGKALGTTTLTTGLAASSLTHKNDVWNTLQD